MSSAITEAPLAPPKTRVRETYAEPTVSVGPDGNILKGVGQIRLSDLPGQFRKDVNKQLRHRKIPVFGGNQRPWFFYTDQAIGTDKAGVPNPPGLFIIFWVHEENQKGSYTGVKELRDNSQGNFIVLEFGYGDTQKGIYTQEDWDTLSWGVKKSLNLKPGPHPTRKAKTRTPNIRWVQGYRVDALNKRDKNGEVGVTFLDDGPYLGCKARVDPNALTESQADSLLVTLSKNLDVVRPETVAKFVPYASRVEEDVLDTL